MGMSKDFIVSKSNKLINSGFDLGLNEQKIILILASQIQPEDKDFNVQEISIKELANILDVSTQNLYRDIPKVTKNLMSKVIEFTEINEKGQEVLIQTAFLSTAKYNKSTGMVTLKFSEELKPYLLELKNLFTSYRLQNALALSSKYAIRFYEKCKQNAFKGSFIWSIEDIKKELALTQKAYERYNNIKNKIITPCVEELNQLTDLTLSYEEVKESRRVVGINIAINTKTKANGIDSNGQKPLKNQITVEDSLKEVELMGRYGSAIVGKAIEYTKSKSGIKDFWAYVEGVAKAMKQSETDNINPKSFNNFQPREYDYDQLENKLLGWEQDDKEIEEPLGKGLKEFGIGAEL